MRLITRRRLEAIEHRARLAGYAEAEHILGAIHAAEMEGAAKALQDMAAERAVAAEALARTRRWINAFVTNDPDDDYPETHGVSLVKRGPA
jgi:hypothetical protein